MRIYELSAPCHFGLEAVLKREIYDLGYDITSVEDGRVNFAGDAEAVCRANIGLRTAERVLINIGSFTAVTFDELFEAVKALPWEEYIPRDGRFWVTKATSVKSRLFSTSDIQSVVKKAVVERLKSVYRVEWFEETGAEFPIRVSFIKDVATLTLDTSGVSLHKRGYRKLVGKAPISETLAAALIMLTPWNKERILADPFCGSGTFLIEAALMAADMAPGMNRTFTAQGWHELIPEMVWENAYEEARDNVSIPAGTDLQGYDIDGDIIAAARRNADLAGVGSLIHFQRRDISEFSHSKKYGFIITNPPYGERLEDRQALPGLYRTFGERFAALDCWSAYVITSYEDAERYIGRKADRNRKIYNGMLKTYYYQFLGPKPPRREKAGER